MHTVVNFHQTANESISALRTVQAYNAIPQEEQRFAEKVDRVLQLARKEAIASGIFFGSTGWSGNVTLLCLLGYGAGISLKQRSFVDNI